MMAPETWAKTIQSYWHNVALSGADDDSALLILSAQGYPAGGLTTHFSYGHNLVGKGKNELVLTVQSDDDGWIESFFYLLEDMLPAADYAPGAMYAAPTQLAADTEMDAWLITEKPIWLWPGLTIPYLLVVPIYAPEVAVLKNVGMRKFLAKVGNDVFTPTRKCQT